MQSKYMVIAGASGVGKTDLAFKAAQELQTEIVGADAFQIYQGLDILTAKPASSQLHSLKHHLISLMPLTQTLDAYQYASLARQTIRELNQRGIIPLVVGGTGFYLHALERSLPSLPAADKNLRAELEQRPTHALLKELAARDAAAFSRIDQQNRRRIIRSLEVCILSGRTFSSFLEDSPPVPTLPRLFLERPRAILVERINQRVNQMFADGVVQEVAAIETIGPTASQAIGFSVIRSLLEGRIDEHTCREAICRQTRQYAKRQCTWFRRQPYDFVSAESSLEYVMVTYRRQFLDSRRGEE
jgi:tRNA dimethylallyltransferase